MTERCWTFTVTIMESVRQPTNSLSRAVEFWDVRIDGPKGSERFSVQKPIHLPYNTGVERFVAAILYDISKATGWPGYKEAS